MITSVRLSKQEQRDLEKKTREINKVLIMNDHPPMQESELVHAILQRSLKIVKAESSGEVILDK